jgi:hypothetical protein
MDATVEGLSKLLEGGVDHGSDGDAPGVVPRGARIDRHPRVPAAVRYAQGATAKQSRGRA